MRLLQLSGQLTRIIAALVFLAVGLGALWESSRLQGLPGSDAVGSGAFPGLAAIALTIAALGLFTGLGDRADPLRIEEPMRVFVALLALVALVTAMGQVSILLSIGVFIIVFQVILGERRPLLILGGGLGVTGLVWFLFGFLLGVPL